MQKLLDLHVIMKELVLSFYLEYLVQLEEVSK